MAQDEQTLEDQEEEARKLNEETYRSDASTFTSDIEEVKTAGGEVARHQSDDPEHNQANAQARVQYSDTGFGDAEPDTDQPDKKGQP